MKLKLTYENLVLTNTITQAKVDILQHTAKRKAIIAAKGSGKTFLGEIDTIVKLEQDSKANGWGIRKFKQDANELLADYFFAALAELKQKGFHINNKYKQVSRGRRISSNTNKNNIHKNQMVNFGSLEATSTSGWKPTNNGYCAIAVIDEPLLLEDILKNKVTKDSEFKLSDDKLIDDLSRYQEPYKQTYKLTPFPFHIYYFLNPWGKHYLTKECQRVFPQEQFVYFIFQYNKNSKDSSISFEDLVKNDELIETWFKDKANLQRLKENNTMSIYDKDSDTLYSRMTKFANPNNCSKENFTKIIQDIKTALFFGNMNDFCILLGLENKPEINKEMLVYHIQNFNHKTKKELAKEKWKPIGISYSVDVDTSRVLTITPGLLYRRIEYEIDGTCILETGIFIDKQIEIPAYGTGTHGELNKVYVKNISDVIKKHFIKDNKYINMDFQTRHLAVDDKRKWYLYALKAELEGILLSFDTFQQHGDYDIISRQDWATLGFNHNVLWNHPDNVALEDDIKTCLRADIQSTKRATTGTTNYLDRIDSFENAYIPFVEVILSSTKD